MSALDDIITLYNSGRSATPMNGDDMQRVINARAELAQLRERVGMTDIMEGDDGLAAINRLYAECERGNIDQHASPDIIEARAEIIANRERIAALETDLQTAQDELKLAVEYTTALREANRGLEQRIAALEAATKHDIECLYGICAGFGDSGYENAAIILEAYVRGMKQHFTGVAALAAHPAAPEQVTEQGDRA